MSGSIGEQKKNILAIKGINENNQRAANFRADVEKWGIFGSITGTGFQYAMGRADFG